MYLDIDLPYFVFPTAGAILGLIVGSFLATLIVRWPQGKSVMAGRSECDACGQQLSALELIPVISYFWQMGKCRKCGTPINRHHLAIELTAGLIGGIAFSVEPGWTGLTGAIFGWLLLTLAALDAQHHWLPDRLTVLLASTGLLSALFIEQPTIVDRLIGGLAGYVPLLLIAILYRMVRNREGLGGGDPKMLGGIGLWLGWQYIPFVVLGASAFGLAFALSVKFRNRPIGLESQFPFGSLLAIAAFPAWLVLSSGANLLGS
ncbi:MAG: A24 family peptidase [Parasphingorhabdus sp.]